MKYFSYFPVVSYANNFVRNILTRVKISDDFKKFSRAYYPYIIEEGSSIGSRLEHIAFEYYEQSEDVWLLHLTNEIIDPYYDVYQTQEDFDKYIEKKYGSVREAIQKIFFYRNNYSQDDSILDESGFNGLPSNLKKYWTPTVNFDNQIIGYERLKDDTQITTNKILSLSLSANSAFEIGEKIEQSVTGASGYVMFSNTSTLTINHITGSFSNTNLLTGDSSLVNATPSSVITLKQNMPDEELVYFSPVTYYDYESELNEQKKNIKIIDSNYKGAIESKFRELMGA